MLTRMNGLQDIIKAAFEHGINMFDTAEGYEAGKSEEEMYAPDSSPPLCLIARSGMSLNAILCLGDEYSRNWE